MGVNVPDLRGLFLRGNGGKAGALGAVQAENVYISKSNGIKIQMENVRRGYATYSIFTENESFNGYVYHHVEFSPNNSGNMLGFSSGSYERPLTISSAAQETRPQNMAVRYLIRALP